jgi:hypothetical protein
MLVTKIVFMTQLTFISVQRAQYHPCHSAFMSSAGLYNRFFHIGRIFFYLFKLVGHPEQSIIRICADFEYKVYIPRAVTAFTFYFIESFKVFELFFLHIDNLTFHFHRACAAPYCLNRDLRQVNIRCKLNRNSEQRNKAEQYKKYNSDCNGNRLFYSGIYKPDFYFQRLQRHPWEQAKHFLCLQG